MWTITAGGGWSTAANWSPNQVPGAADQAFVTNAGNYTVTPSANAAAIVTLGGAGGAPTIQHTAGTLTLGSGSRIRSGGIFEWAAGTLAGALLVESGGLLRLTTAAPKGLNGALTNAGTVALVGSGDLSAYALNGAYMANQGVLDFQSTASLWGDNNPVLRNTGVVRKSAGAGDARIGVLGSWPVVFENAGEVDARFGTLRFFGSCNLTNGLIRSAIRGLTDFGQVSSATTVPLAGAVGAYLVGGYEPDVGNAFNLVTFSSATGAFDTLQLPSSFLWQTNYLAGSFRITVSGIVTPTDFELTIRQEAGQVIIEWPAACGDCELWEGGQLGAGAYWTPSALAPSQVGEVFRVTLWPAQAAWFYRLVRPN